MQLGKTLRQNSAFLYLIFLIILTAPSFADELSTWAQHSRPLFLENLLKNISPEGTVRGTVIASPSRENPNYYFHWVRDSSLVMQTILNEYQKASNPTLKNKYLQKIEDFIRLSKANQAAASQVTAYAVARFNVDGTIPSDKWPSPQDDGPALRAVFFIRLAQIWIAEGHSDWVKEKLYNSQTQSLIKSDLEFTSHSWQRTSYDLWEELHGHHFFTRIAQRRALIEGGKLALVLHDYDAGGWYLKQADLLQNQMLNYWNENKGYLLGSLNVDGGIQYKTSQLDTSVLLGVLYNSLQDGFYSLTDSKVLSTVSKLGQTFRQLYGINQKNLRGIAIGRYPEDRYDGISGDTQGSPWFLTTVAFAEYYYKVAKIFRAEGRISVNSRNLDFFQSLNVGRFTQGDVFPKSDKTFQLILAKIRETGDDYLWRVMHHGLSNGSLSEQFNRNSGYMQGANDLSWSYSAVVDALDARNKP